MLLKLSNKPECAQNQSWLLFNFSWHFYQLHADHFFPLLPHLQPEIIFVSEIIIWKNQFLSSSREELEMIGNEMLCNVHAKMEIVVK